MDKANLLKNAMAIGGLAVNMFQAYGGQNANTGANTGNPGQSKLRTLINQCSYPQKYNNVLPRSIELISMAAENALREFPELDCDILSYLQGNTKKSFIELKGKVPVDFRGSTYGVNINLMIPQNFPNKPPYVRIINDSPDKYLVDPYYTTYKSQIDPNSYLLNNLQSIVNWGYQSSVVGVIKEALQVMSGRFPFRKRKANEQDGVAQNAYNQNMYPGSQPGFGPSVGFGYNPQPSYNPQPAFNSNPMPSYNSNPMPGFGSGSHSQGYQQPQQFMNNAFGSNSYGNPTMPTNAGFYNPAQQKARTELQAYLKNSKAFLNEMPKTVDTLEKGHQKLFIMSQNQDSINRQILSQMTEVKQRTEQLSNFIKTSESTGDTIDLKSLVVPRDDFANQMLELVAENKAWVESSAFVESQFTSDKIPLSDFLKLMRKVEEERFLSGYMIKKCIKSRGKQ